MLQVLTNVSNREKVNSRQANGHRNKVRVYSLQNFSSSMFGTTGLKYQLPIEIASAGIIEDATLRISVTVASAAVTVMPIQYWFEKMEWYFDNENNILQTFHPDSQFIKHAVTLTPAHWESFASKMGVRGPDSYYQDAKPLQVGTHVFYLPFTNDVISRIRPYMAALNSNIVLQLYPRNGICVSGTNSNLTVTSVNLICNEMVPTEVQHASLVAAMRQPIEYPFVEGRKHEVGNITLTQGQITNIDLQPLQGKVCAMVVGVRSGTLSSSNRNKLWNLGRNTYFDITSADGSSLFSGAQTNLRLDEVKDIEVSRYLESDFFRKQNWYLIPFCDNIQTAFHGRAEGYLEFDGNQKTNLQINVDATAPVAEVFTVTVSATADKGFYAIVIGGEQSAWLAYNASTSDMKTAIEAMDVVKRHCWTVTASTTVSAGTSFTLTFATGIGGTHFSLDELYGPPTFVTNHLLDDTAACSISAALTTKGVSGWTTASSLTVFVYYFVHRFSVQLGNQLQSRTDRL